MPREFLLPGKKNQEETSTHYRVFVGRQSVFDYRRSHTLGELDGLASRTWMVMETAEAVPWTKPEEVQYDPNEPLPRMGDFLAGGFNVAMVDGSVSFQAKPPPEAIIRAAIAVSESHDQNAASPAKNSEPPAPTQKDAESHGDKDHSNAVSRHPSAQRPTRHRTILNGLMLVIG
jgi:prepilin-type processing-associated H-X9-DG protein